MKVLKKYYWIFGLLLIIGGYFISYKTNYQWFTKHEMILIFWCFSCGVHLGAVTLQVKNQLNLPLWNRARKYAMS
mgnify:CR=1 FL=1